uniref:Uncharacterized protein n=1 Tax=Thermogemmatispora argillosa TaxID=2045280 RepID=A0A455T7D4_9CHLR|nr:hypothetical protein KTA_29130 [Thermogemmatispora argillosa]
MEPHCVGDQNSARRGHRDRQDYRAHRCAHMSGIGRGRAAGLADTWSRSIQPNNQRSLFKKCNIRTRFLARGNPRSRHGTEAVSTVTVAHGLQAPSSELLA